MTKPFSKELYDADDNAKEQVIKLLATKGVKVVVNPDQYGIDLVGTYQGQPRSYEIEVKHNWKGKDFPFDKVHISARKLKFAWPMSRFIMLNDDRTEAILIQGQDVAECPIITKSTIYTKDEQFIEIPLERTVRLPL